MPTMRDYVVLTINGELHSIRGADAFMMLADYLRCNLALTGTKIVCAEGDCGACTVLCSRPQATDANFLPINSCIAMVAQLDGAHILTVESLKQDNLLSPVQDAIVKAHGSQCGFCTPGFAMVMTALWEKKREPLSKQRVKNQLTGNLCRCTGYQTLIDAALRIEPNHVTPLSERFLKSKTMQEKPMHLKHGPQEFYAPIDLSQALEFLGLRPETKLIAAATDMGVMINKQKTHITSAMSLHLIPELNKIELQGQTIKVGAGVSLADLREYCRELLPEFARFINIFASLQIKNMATLVGNIANGSPIADTLPFLMVANAHLSVLSKAGTRLIPLTKLYQGYKKLSLDAGEIITHASFNIPPKSQILRLYKITQRRDLDIATVNGAFCFDLEPKGGRIQEARIALGGVAETVVRLQRLENFFVGKFLKPEIIPEACEIIQQEISPLSDLRGSASFRRILVDGMIRRFIDEISGSHHDLA